MNRIFLAIGIAIIAVLVASSSLFIVDQRKVAVIKTFGEIKSVVTEPGLNFNWPLVQTVSMLDKRIQTLDNPTPGPIFTAEKKSLVIDWLVKCASTTRASSSATTPASSATSRSAWRR